MSLRSILVLLLVTQSLFARWGWTSHRFINDAAVDRLPAEMSFFQDHRDYLTEHSVDPDQSSDPNPGYYHYIDIDHYDEFFTGEMPHTWTEMIAMYGQETVEDQGTIPWVIEWWMEDLRYFMAEGNWNDAWQIAAELGHYVADSHQAMHLTVNYNGQNSGNYGIHSRYETQMINRHIDSVVLPDSTAGYWESPIDSVFQYIEEIYPVVGLVLDADDAAYAVDPNYGTSYYNMMWDALGDTTIWTLNKAVVDLASAWYTAWLNAGSPYPAGVAVDEMELPQSAFLKASPNPFNGQTNLSFYADQDIKGELKIFDLRGSLLRSFPIETAGSVSWDGKDDQGIALGTGVYIAQVGNGHAGVLTKLTLLK
jgi:hypothetical protein